MGTTNAFTRFSAADLFHRMDNKEAVHLIHVVTKDHFNKAHIHGAANACVFEVTFLDQIKAITEGKNAEIVLYGASDRSRDAAAAAEKLVRAGYENIAVLKGGMEAWRESGSMGRMNRGTCSGWKTGHTAWMRIKASLNGREETPTPGTPGRCPSQKGISM
ncbi:MAG: rhodanese-like domain-containing protein [Deltaproteobacteria bacterium]|nr:rhodanese-like domain-containing protein [Deltaproteobacteria bacterium]